MRYLFAALTLVPALVAQAPSTPPLAVADPFAALGFLEGEWKGEGGGLPGQAAGAAGFRFEVQGKVLVRHSFADMAAADGRPASRHEDLMTIYAEGGQLKALYLDNENHVIRYLVSEVAGGAAFTSEPWPGPRFRLTYLRRADALVSVRFEIAPPGKPEAFSTYLEALTRKVK